ncbi:MAG: ABC transporter ATP-binding protein [Alphaproteobacteria bacterium]|nr:ABC transporter ATP-binding protein [Alphaproteobacteria bacterium]
MSEVLKLKHITRTYHQADKTLEVLRGVNLELKAGEVVALVGPSGSGKSTLLQIAGLLDNPTSGQVMLAGLDMSKASDGERTAARLKHIGFVYQFHHLLPEFSALENITLPQMMQGVRESEANQQSEMLLATLGLSQRASHRPAKLSGGEQQRVAIARALAGQPALLLADEPTGNLDQHTAEEVFSLLMKLAHERKLAALIATHNLDLARRMDRMVRLEDGVLK